VPDEPIRVTVWNEYFHELQEEEKEVRAHYPDGIHQVLAAGLESQLGGRISVRTATLDADQHGLTPEVLRATDVLLWWGHRKHAAVSDEIVERVHQRVLAGMGLIVLHSGHYSKIFRRLMGTTCSLMWRHEEGGERETVWTVAPDHPIAADVPHPIVLDAQEMYGEFFDIPAPDELVFVSSFSGGEVFRSGCTFLRGRGRIFYFSPGDQKYPVYHHPAIRRVLANATIWAYQEHNRSDQPWGSRRTGPGWFDTSAEGRHA
jgi:trehalose utilization protein